MKQCSIGGKMMHEKLKEYEKTCSVVYTLLGRVKQGIIEFSPISNSDLQN